MAFPTSPPLSRVWEQFSDRARSLKAYCVEFNARSAANTLSGTSIEELMRQLASFASYAKASSTTPGLAAYVSAQYVGRNIDIVAEYSAMIATVDNALAWIANNIPKANGYVQLEQWGVDGSITQRQFAPAALNDLRTVVATVIAAIE